MRYRRSFAVPPWGGPAYPFSRLWNTIASLNGDNGVSSGRSNENRCGPVCQETAASPTICNAKNWLYNEEWSGLPGGRNSLLRADCVPSNSGFVIGTELHPHTRLWSAAMTRTPWGDATELRDANAAPWARHAARRGRAQPARAALRGDGRDGRREGLRGDHGRRPGRALRRLPQRLLPPLRRQAGVLPDRGRGADRADPRDHGAGRAARASGEERTRAGARGLPEA